MKISDIITNICFNCNKNDCCCIFKSLYTENGFYKVFSFIIDNFIIDICESKNNKTNEVTIIISDANFKDKYTFNIELNSSIQDLIDKIQIYNIFQ